MSARRPRSLALPACLCLWILAGSCAASAASADPGDNPFGGRANVLVLGDSLGVGMMPYLGAMMPGKNVVWEVRHGRSTAGGMFALRDTLRWLMPDVVLISLGTNDGPDPRRFQSRMRRIMRMLPDSSCVVWPTVRRPPRKGPYLALNQYLRAEARLERRLTILNWDVAVDRGWVRLRDEVHPDAPGFEERSRMYADAADEACG